MARAGTRALRRRRAIHGLVVACGFIPFGVLVVGALSDRLGANPVETITHTTGEWALRFLVGALAITPLRRLFSRSLVCEISSRRFFRFLDLSWFF